MNTLEMNRAPQPQESLAEYIRRVRIELGLSQRELAEGAGIHLQSVGKLERGKTSKLEPQNSKRFSVCPPNSARVPHRDRSRRGN